ncbi:MAG: S1 RNA-binding domain-containing protein [Planctomycetota bacterium]
MAKKNDFRDYFEDFSEGVNLSDADLDAMLAGSFATQDTEPEVGDLKPGDLVEGVVVSQQETELLIEIGSKLHGVVPREEFDGVALPALGSRIAAHFARRDDERGVLVLGVKEVQREVFWGEVREGHRFEGTVVAENRGGLTLEIRGTRAFLPISQIERNRVDDLKPYLGQRMQVEVTAVDRGKQDLVVSRRRILDAEWEEEKVRAVARIRVGDEVRGRVTRINQHGAFVDIGGVEGLVHASKLRAAQGKADSAPVREGQDLEVRIAYVDPGAGRVGLDLRVIADDPWQHIAADYAQGDDVTGLVKRLTAEGAVITLDEGLEGWIPASAMTAAVRVGSLCQARVVRVDAGARRLELRPR